MNVSLCREDGVYEAATTLHAKWRIRRVALDDIHCVELSVMWHTEGKGDEDLHVHHFERFVESQIRRRGLADEQVLSCVLPASPLSYHGRLISVRWCIRLRLFLNGGREIVAEQPFHLITPGSDPILGQIGTRRDLSHPERPPRREVDEALLLQRPPRSDGLADPGAVSRRRTTVTTSVP